MQKKRSWEWIHTRMSGYTLGDRQLHETTFLSGMQPFMPFFLSASTQSLAQVVNSSVKGQSLSISSPAFVQHLDHHCQYIITFSIIIYYRNEEYQTTWKQIFKGNLCQKKKEITARSSNLIVHTFNVLCI